MRELVVPNEVVCKHAGNNAYWFMRTTAELEADPQMKALLDTKRNCWFGYLIGKEGKFFIWYDVQE